MTDKSILVINTPSSCKECDIRKRCDYANYIGNPTDCPLKPLPKEMERTENEDTISLSFRNGWNSYYFEITGGEEE